MHNQLEVRADIYPIPLSTTQPNIKSHSNLLDFPVTQLDLKGCPLRPSEEPPTCALLPHSGLIPHSSTTSCGTLSLGYITFEVLAPSHELLTHEAPKGITRGSSCSWPTYSIKYISLIVSCGLFQYYVCELKNGEIVVVPRQWMKMMDDKWFTFWTSSLKNVKECAVPNPHWKQYEVVKIWGKYDSYTAADKSISGISSQNPVDDVVVSDFEDEEIQVMSDTVVTKRTIKRPRKYSSSSDEINACMKKKSKKSKKTDTSTTVLARTFLGQLVEPPARTNDSLTPEDSDKDDIFASSSDQASDISDESHVDTTTHFSSGDSGSQPVNKSSDLTQSSCASPGQPSTVPSPSETSNADQDSGTSLKRLTEIAKATYKAVDEIRGYVKSLEEDMQRIKAALVQHLPEEQREDIFRLEQHDSSEPFEAFCKKLENRNFKKLVTKFMIVTYGSRDIGDVARSALKATMTNNLMTQYNRTGARNKNKLHPLYEQCIYDTIKHFYKDEKEIKVKKGSAKLNTTVKAEMARKIEKFLSNASSRCQRESIQ
ncbi:uncharacterized protein LOC143032595 [Oratosquilla oratoria]|uniref:uncharacterized protein LOC143032595 n=1 Tax=Oratosquilla oratoria TaxID=337810 RepID=UPI003F76BCD9